MNAPVPNKKYDYLNINGIKIKTFRNEVEDLKSVIDGFITFTKLLGYDIKYVNFPSMSIRMRIEISKEGKNTIYLLFEIYGSYRFKHIIVSAGNKTTISISPSPEDVQKLLQEISKSL